MKQPIQITIPWLARDIGLGDIIKRLTGFIGIRASANCGCKNRADSLNRLVVFTSGK